MTLVRLQYLCVYLASGTSSRLRWVRILPPPQDEDETDVDCGGSSCGPCPTGSSCLVDTDCLINNCTESPGVDSTTTAEGTRTCFSPPKSCPSDCGGDDRGTCQHVSSASGEFLLPSECLADASIVTCRPKCTCLEGYGGDGCQYSDEELTIVRGIRQGTLEYVKTASSGLDVTVDTLTRQATLLSMASGVAVVGSWG